MALDVIRYSGDLKIATAQGGTITLDTGGTTGTVTITGSLNVLGKQTNIAFSNTNITDNLLLINAGESNPYVSYGTAGIAVDRGSRDSTTSSARLVYNEDAWVWTKSNGTTEQSSGTWSITVGNGVSQKGSALRLSSLMLDYSGVVDATTTTNRMIMLGNSGQPEMLSVIGQNNYAARVQHPDDIPNKEYVDNRPFSGTATQALTSYELRQGNTYITVSDDSVSGLPSKITTYIDGVSTMIVQGGSTTINGISIVNRTIRSNVSNADLILQTFGTGTTVVNNGLSVGVSPVPPFKSQGQVKIYSTSTLGAGSTGLLFVAEDNRTLPATEVRGELISARKALVFSIIF